MKSTDIARRDREIKKGRKKEEVLQKKVSKRDNLSVGEFINKLHSLFFHDEHKIYNLDSEEIKEIVEDVKNSLPEKQWENVIKKAVRKTKITERDQACNTLMNYFSD